MSIKCWPPEEWAGIKHLGKRSLPSPMEVVDCMPVLSMVPDFLFCDNLCQCLVKDNVYQGLIRSGSTEVK